MQIIIDDISPLFLWNISDIIHVLAAQFNLAASFNGTYIENDRTYIEVNTEDSADLMEFTSAIKNSLTTVLTNMYGFSMYYYYDHICGYEHKYIGWINDITCNYPDYLFLGLVFSHGYIAIYGGYGNLMRPVLRQSIIEFTGVNYSGDDFPRHVIVTVELLTAIYEYVLTKFKNVCR